jgi:UDP:flavonoid glycosyltransferase YjiC (YdhE family)
MIARLLADRAMRQRLAAVSKHMQAAKGTDKAADILVEIATTGRYSG